MPFSKSCSCRRFVVGWGVVSGGLFLASAAAARADLIADGFASGTDQYTVGGIKNQNPAVPSFTSGWTQGTGSAKFHVDPEKNGLTSPGLTYPTGGSVGVTGATADAGQTIGRSVSVTNSATYYMSGIYVRGNSASITNGAYAFMGWGNGVTPALGTSGSGVRGVYVGFVQTAETSSGGTADDFGDLVIRTRQTINGTAQTVDTILADGQARSTYLVNYFVVTKLTVGTTDALSYWVNPTSIASDAAMDATADTYGSVTVDTVGTGAADLKQLTFAESAYNALFSFDEPRVATTLADLAAATPTPEPAGAGGLLACGVAALAGRRRGRRAISGPLSPVLGGEGTGGPSA